jgi:hypothetical protein
VRKHHCRMCGRCSQLLALAFLTLRFPVPHPPARAMPSLYLSSQKHSFQLGGFCVRSAANPL